MTRLSQNQPPETAQSQQAKHLLTLSSARGPWHSVQQEWQITGLILSPGGIQNAGLKREGRVIKKDDFGDRPHRIFQIENTVTGTTVYAGPNDIRTLFSPGRDAEINELARNKTQQVQYYQYRVKQAFILSALMSDSDSRSSIKKLNQLPAIGDRHFPLIDTLWGISEFHLQDRTGYDIASFDTISDFLSQVHEARVLGKLQFIAPDEAKTLAEFTRQVNENTPLSAEQIDFAVTFCERLVALHDHLNAARLSWGRQTATAVSALHEPCSPAYQANLWVAHWLKDNYLDKSKHPQILDIGANLSVFHRAFESILDPAQKELALVTDCEKDPVIFNSAPNPKKIQVDIGDIYEDGWPVIVSSAGVHSDTPQFDILMANFVFDQLAPQELMHALYALEHLSAQKTGADGTTLILSSPEGCHIRARPLHDVLTGPGGYTETYSDSKIVNKLAARTRASLEKEYGVDYAAAIAKAVSKPFNVTIYKKIRSMDEAAMQALPLSAFTLRETRAPRNSRGKVQNAVLYLPEVSALSRLDIQSVIEPADIVTPKGATVTRAEIETARTYKQFEDNLTTLLQFASLTSASEQRQIERIRKKWDDEQCAFLSEKEFNFVMSRPAVKKGPASLSRADLAQSGNGVLADRLASQAERYRSKVIQDVYTLFDKEPGERLSKNQKQLLQSELDRADGQIKKRRYSLSELARVKRPSLSLRPEHIRFRLRLLKAVLSLPKTTAPSLTYLRKTAGCTTGQLFARSADWQYLHTLPLKSEIDQTKRTAGPRAPGLQAALDNARIKPPRDHQAAQVNACLEGFQSNGRGQLIAPCGSGKTLSLKFINDALGSTCTLGVFPSLSLIAQTYNEWVNTSKSKFSVLAVCSDKSVLNRENDPVTESELRELGMQVTTNPAEIVSFLLRDNSLPKLILSTYHSSEHVATAQRRRGAPSFQFGFADEAHVLAGDMASRHKVFLDEKAIRIDKRLFATATPRVLTERAKRKSKELALQWVSMDDEHVFGPRFHEMTFRQAIEARLLVDYKVVVFVTTNSQIEAYLQGTKKQPASSEAIFELSKQIALLKAMTRYDLKTCISFHSRVKKAKAFTDPDHPRSIHTATQVSDKLLSVSTLWAKHINASTSAAKRRALIDSFASLPDDTVGILSNCACLGVGVDIDNLDSIMFSDPRRGTIDITQAIGRVLRKPGNPKLTKPFGYIILPVFIPDQQHSSDLNADKLLEMSSFRSVWAVARALRAMDSSFDEHLTDLAAKNSDSKRKKSSTIPNFDIVTDNSQLAEVSADVIQQLEASLAASIVRTTSPPRLELSVGLIREWAERQRNHTGVMPSKKSGTVYMEPDENWMNIDYALRFGLRGLPAGLSVGKVLNPNVVGRANLTEEKIKKWMIAQYKATGTIPSKESGYVYGHPDEHWGAIQAYLMRGARGLSGTVSFGEIRNQVRLEIGDPTFAPLTPTTLRNAIQRRINSTGEAPTSPKERESSGIGNRSWRGIDSFLRKKERPEFKARSLNEFIRIHFPDASS